jgi:LysR family transcriptional regulator, glycine cleavage system transcriptional activator
MDFDSLRCFIAAADNLTFRGAAKKVGLSPGAFSDRIRRIEDDVGVALFHRTTRQVVVSEAGLRLLPHARQLLADVERCRDLARGGHEPQPYALTLGTRFELGLSWLTPNLSGLAAAHPERTVHLYMGDTPDLMSRVERGDLDAVVLSARITSARVLYANLHVESYLFVAAPGAGPCASPDQARAHTLLDVAPDLPLFRYLLDASPSSEPWPFARYEYLGGIGAIRVRALAGAGVAVLPAYFVRDDLAAGRLVELDPGRELREDAFRLIWRREHPFADRLLALSRELRAMPLR